MSMKIIIVAKYESNVTFYDDKCNNNNNNNNEIELIK